MMRNTSSLVCTSLLALSLLACEEEAKPPVETQATAVATPPPAPTPEPPPAPKDERPAEIDTKLTDERRSKIEASVAEAKGFLVASELEQKLKAKKPTDEKKAVPAFDAMAKNKWVLFTGPVTNVKDGQFDLAVSYTSRVENDPIGLSRQFFLVTFSDVEGFDAKKLEAGKMAVVLAKYQGAQKASSGKELVEARLW
jgi:hypothetical protein